MKEISESILRKVEWSVAIIVTLVIVVLHFRFMLHAGGLWRDEASTINLAEMPSLAEVWKHLYYDSFPIGWVLIVRIWWLLGFGSDMGFRILGFLTGVFGLLSLWITARSFKMKFPMFSLVLLGANPLLITFGDSMRAWGFGVFWLVLLYGLIWRVMQAPTQGNVFAAILCAIGAVQSTYYNSVLLLVLCVAGFIVLLRRRLWSRAVLIVSIGAVAGLTMLPYLHVLQIGANHYSIIRETFFWRQFTEKLLNAMCGLEPFMKELLDLRVWWIALMIAVPVALVCQFLPEKSNVAISQKNLLLFGILTIGMGVPAYYFFLHELRYLTSPWYYLHLIALCVVALESIFSIAENWEMGRLFRLVTTLILIGLVVPTTFSVVKFRMTNADLVAERLNRSVSKNDFIVVEPFCAIAFARDYFGEARWTSIPRMDSRLHRYDTLKKLMLEKDRKQAVQPVLDEMQKTLKSGGRVWIVGTSFMPHRLPSRPVPRAYNPNPGAMDTVSALNYWWYLAGKFLETHSLHRELVTIPVSDRVSALENLEVMMASDWRDK